VQRIGGNCSLTRSFLFWRDILAFHVENLRTFRRQGAIVAQMHRIRTLADVRPNKKLVVVPASLAANFQRGAGNHVFDTASMARPRLHSDLRVPPAPTAP